MSVALICSIKPYYDSIGAHHTLVLHAVVPLVARKIVPLALCWPADLSCSAVNKPPAILEGRTFYVHSLDLNRVDTLVIERYVPFVAFALYSTNDSVKVART